MKIKIGLKIRYFYPFSAGKKYSDCNVVEITAKNYFLKLKNENAKLIIPRTKESLKQMKVIK